MVTNQFYVLKIPKFIRLALPEYPFHDQRVAVGTQP